MRYPCGSWLAGDGPQSGPLGPYRSKSPAASGWYSTSSSFSLRVLPPGADRVVFSGVGKTRDDMRRALEVGVHCLSLIHI